MPVFLEMRDLNAEIPRNRFHENPPALIWFGLFSSGVSSVCPFPESAYSLEEQKGDSEGKHPLKWRHA